MTSKTAVPTGEKIGTISIDLVPYPVVKEGEHLVVKECSGSILAQLEVPDRHCWTRYYGGWLGDRFGAISYSSDDEGSCSFKTDSFDAVVNWVSEKFDAIISIGYEVLEDLN